MQSVYDVQPVLKSNEKKIFFEYSIKYMIQTLKNAVKWRLFERFSSFLPFLKILEFLFFKEALWLTSFQCSIVWNGKLKCCCIYHKRRRFGWSWEPREFQTKERRNKNWKILLVGGYIKLTRRTAKAACSAWNNSY